MGLRNSCDPSTPLYYIGRDTETDDEIDFSLRFFKRERERRGRFEKKRAPNINWVQAGGWLLVGG
jgi:hypothetical protein